MNIGLIFLAALVLILILVFFKCTLPGVLHILNIRVDDEIGTMCLFMGGFVLLSSISSFILLIIREIQKPSPPAAGK
jgi:hypothetical protein